MSVTLKRGKAHDLHLVLGRHFERHSSSFVKLFDCLSENSINYTYTSKEEARYAIQFYLNPNKKEDKSKAKPAVDQNAKTKKKEETLDINSLLAKYSYQPQPKSTTTCKPKCKLPEDYKLKLSLIYMNSLNISDLIPYFELLKKTNLDDIKHLFVLEGVEDSISSKEMKMKRQKKDFEFSQQIGSQSQSQGFSFEREDSGMSGIDPVIKNKEELDEFLMSLSIESELDYKFTTNSDETLEFIKECIGSIIESKYKSNLGHFDTKGHSHTMISVYSGFEDFYSLAWIEVLMAIPGISEDKAVAIAKEYPTMKLLMDALEENPDGKLFEDVKVVHNYDQSKAKRLGKAASSKIVKCFTSKNPNDIV